MSNTAQPDPEGQIKQASFDWALRGSWEEFEKELGRMLHKAALTVPKPPSWSTVVSNKLAPATQAFNNAPDWGKGAIIGAGAGALGGLLMDKKKRLRGLLQGALVGSGMGALGGYGYGQVKNLANAVAGGPPPDYETITRDVANPGGGKTNQPNANAAPTEPSLAKQTLDKTLGLSGKVLREAATSPLPYGLGAIYGGKKLIDYSNKGVHVVGSGVQQPALGPNTIAAHGSRQSILNSIKNDPGVMQDLFSRVIFDRQIKGLAPNNQLTKPTPAEVQQNLKNYLTPPKGKTPFWKPEVEIQQGGKKYTIPAGSAEDMRIQQQANSIGKNSLPSEARVRLKQRAARWAGRGLAGFVGPVVTGAGLLDAGEKALKYPWSTNEAAIKNFGAFQPVFDGPGQRGEKELANFLSAAKKTADPSQSVADMARRSGWTAEVTKAVMQRLMEMP